MTVNNVTAAFEVGAEITGPVRLMTAERIEWYDSAMLSAAKGELARVGSNIHTDEAYARSQGLPAVIADGMIMTNWVSSMLVEHFGLAYVGERLVVSGRITDRYVKRGRTYIDYYLEVRTSDGRLVTTYTDKTLLKYEPEGTA